MAEELAAVAAEGVPARETRRHRHLLVVRRLREVVNTTGHDLPGVRRRHSGNAAALHPKDMQALGLQEGDAVEVTSDFGAIHTRVEADDTLRSGVVSISHGWGGLPDDTDDRQRGANSNLLVRTDREVETINAMPAMSAIPVTIRKAQSAHMRTIKSTTGRPLKTSLDLGSILEEINR